MPARLFFPQSRFSLPTSHITLRSVSVSRMMISAQPLALSNNPHITPADTSR
jgi:hypothetical protein